jgi:hypothetical protein
MDINAIEELGMVLERNRGGIKRSEELDTEEVASVDAVTNPLMPMTKLCNETLAVALLSKLDDCNCIMGIDPSLLQETKLLMTARHIVGMSCLEDGMVAAGLHREYMIARCKNYLAILIILRTPNPNAYSPKNRTREDVYLDNLKELIFQISEILIDNEYKLAVDGISISALSSLFYKSFAPDLGYRSFDASMENFLNTADVAKNLKEALLVRIKTR